MDFDPEALRELREAVMDGIAPSAGHQASPAERRRAWELYASMREARYGRPPAGERMRNSLAGESPFVRGLFGG